MIAKLRHRHRILFPVLAILIVVVAIFGLKEKPDIENTELPGYFNEVTIYDVEQISTHFILWDKDGIDDYLTSLKTDSSIFYLQLEVHRKFNQADPLIYLNMNGESVISEKSVLLGSLNNNHFHFFKLPLTDIAKIDSSKFLIYSLPKHEIINIGEILKREDLK